MRIRKNVKSLSSVEKTNFVNAVLALKHRPRTLHPINQFQGDITLFMN
jgi:hypothetical protein